jgi:hypothetical protein
MSLFQAIRLDADRARLEPDLDSELALLAREFSVK